MSGFDATWLDLREPADLAARHPNLLAKAAESLRGQDHVTVVDLGCGTGSTFRAFEGRLPASQNWRLVDRDEALLRIAAERIARKADVEPLAADLGDIDALPLAGADLVTASALFDLTSEAFVAELAERLAHEHVGLYAALTYDGTIVWSEEDALDRPIVSAFNEHQRTDKGLGPALGPQAGRRLAKHLSACGFAVETAESPWRMSAGQDALQRAFLEGMILAVSQTGRIEAGSLQDWYGRRMRALPRGHCTVGHVDILALSA